MPHATDWANLDAIGAASAIVAHTRLSVGDGRSVHSSPERVLTPAPRESSNGSLPRQSKPDPCAHFISRYRRALREPAAIEATCFYPNFICELLQGSVESLVVIALSRIPENKRINLKKAVELSGWGKLSG